MRREEGSEGGRYFDVPEAIYCLLIPEGKPSHQHSRAAHALAHVQLSSFCVYIKIIAPQSVYPAPKRDLELYCRSDIGDGEHVLVVPSKLL